MGDIILPVPNQHILNQSQWWKHQSNVWDLLTVKIPEWSPWGHSGFYFVGFEQIPHFSGVSLVEFQQIIIGWVYSFLQNKHTNIPEFRYSLLSLKTLRAELQENYWTLDRARKLTLGEKWSFPLSISSVNMTKSAVGSFLEKWNKAYSIWLCRNNFIILAVNYFGKSSIRDVWQGPKHTLRKVCCLHLGLQFSFQIGPNIFYQYLLIICVA